MDKLIENLDKILQNNNDWNQLVIKIEKLEETVEELEFYVEVLEDELRNLE